MKVTKKQFFGIVAGTLLIIAVLVSLAMTWLVQGIAAQFGVHLTFLQALIIYAGLLILAVLFTPSK